MSDKTVTVAELMEFLVTLPPETRVMGFVSNHGHSFGRGVTHYRRAHWYTDPGYQMVYLGDFTIEDHHWNGEVPDGPTIFTGRYFDEYADQIAVPGREFSVIRSRGGSA